MCPLTLLCYIAAFRFSLPTLDVVLRPNFKKVDPYVSEFYGSVFSDPRIARDRSFSFMREVSKHLSEISVRVSEDKQLLDEILRPADDTVFFSAVNSGKF